MFKNLDRMVINALHKKPVLLDSSRWTHCITFSPYCLAYIRKANLSTTISQNQCLQTKCVNWQLKVNEVGQGVDYKQNLRQKKL